MEREEERTGQGRVVEGKVREREWRRWIRDEEVHKARLENGFEAIVQKVENGRRDVVHKTSVKYLGKACGKEVKKNDVEGYKVK